MSRRRDIGKAPFASGLASGFALARKGRDDIRSFLRGRGVAPRPDMLDMGMAVLLGDLAAAREYRRGEPAIVRCRIVVMHWRDDPDVSLKQLQGWRRYSDSVEFQVVDGGHHDFMNMPRELRELLTCWR